MDALVLSEKTKVPIGWVFVLLSASGAGLITAGGVGIYVASVSSKADASTMIAMNAQAKAISAEAKAESMNSYMMEVNTRLSRIEGYLKDRK